MSTLTHEELQHRLAVARDYDDLTGLYSCAIGLALLAGQISHNSWAWPLFMLAGTFSAKAYYRHRHGARVASEQATARGILVGIILVVVALPLLVFLVPETLPAGMMHPIAWPFAGLGLLLALSYRIGYRHVGVTRWHWATAATLCLASLSPLVGLPASRNGVVVAGGLAMVVVGLVDHLRLERALSPLDQQ